MARTAITPITVVHGGTVVATTTPDAANNNSFPNNTGAPMLLFVNNTSTAATIGTLHTNVTIDGTLTVPNRTVTVAASSMQIFGPFSSSYTQTDGNVYIDFTPVTSVGVAVLTHGS